MRGLSLERFRLSLLLPSVTGEREEGVEERVTAVVACESGI